MAHAPKRGSELLDLFQWPLAGLYAIPKTIWRAFGFSPVSSSWQGSATQGDVAKAFGVPLVAIKRATKLYRERGPAGFFVPARRREGSKLNAEKLEQARALLVQGHPLPVVSAQTGVLSDTLRKAINAGRLPAVKKTGAESLRVSSRLRT